MEHNKNQVLFSQALIEKAGSLAANETTFPCHQILVVYESFMGSKNKGMVVLLMSPTPPFKYKTPQTEHGLGSFPYTSIREMSYENQIKQIRLDS